MATLLEPNFDGIPLALRLLPQWLCWVAKPDSGRITKPPICVAESRFAKNYPSDLSSFDNARQYYEKFKGRLINGYPLSGIGFYLFETNSLVGIDIDHCIKDGKINDESSEIISSLGGYAEQSVSGSGVHLFVRGNIDRFSFHKRSGIELYWNLRFLTVTGKKINGDVACIQ